MAKKYPTVEFMINVSIIGGTSTAAVKMRFSINEFQLEFKFINKVLLPRFKKRIIASVIDLFMTEYLRNFNY